MRLKVSKLCLAFLYKGNMLPEPFNVSHGTLGFHETRFKYRYLKLCGAEISKTGEKYSH